LDEALKEVRRIFATEEIMEISSKTGANQSALLSKIGERLDVSSRSYAEASIIGFKK